MPADEAVFAFAISIVTALVVTPWAGKLALRLGVIDYPDEDPTGRKQHRAPIPYLGGVAIICAIGAGSSLLAIGDQPSMEIRKFILGVGIAASLGFVGLWDDARPLPRLVRLAAQIAAALGTWWIGFRVDATPWPALDMAITVLWIVGATNAFNLLDNMDGLSAGLAAVGAISFALMGVLEELDVLAVVAASLSGGAFGFLFHNRHPAKVFMGDAGSLFIGFLLALIGIELRFDNLQTVTFLVPIVALGLPIFDTTLVVLSRAFHRRPVLEGGLDHVSHRLVRVGLPVRAAVGLLYWCGLCLGWLGFVISRSTVEVGWMLLGFVMALGVFFGALLWRVPVYSDSGSTAEALASVEKASERDVVLSSLQK